MRTISVQTARRHWWTLLLRGILSILFGVIALADPRIALLAFIYVFAAYAILDGIAAITVSLLERGTLRIWWILLLEGIIGLFFGILAFVWPGETALILLYLVAFWALVTGIMEIGSAFIMSGSMGLRWERGLAGIVSFLFGLVLIFRPGAGLLVVLWLVGIYAVVFGILLIVSAFRVRSLASALSQHREEPRS